MWKKNNRNADLDKHMSKHTGEKSYKCIKCEKTFARNHHLTEHMINHTGEIPHKCAQKKNLAQNAHLVADMRIHSLEKLYECINVVKHSPNQQAYLLI